MRAYSQLYDESGDDSPPASHFDIIVVGSGPGAAGFIHRLLMLRPSMAVGWFEEGQRADIVGWPADLDKQMEAGNVPDHRFTSRPWLRARSWRAFGGGDAMNSGGPNYLGLQVPNERYEPVDVFSLRSKSILPQSDLGDCLVHAFTEQAGYTECSPLPSTVSGSQHGYKDTPGYVGYPSSIYLPGDTPGGARRQYLAEDLADRVAALHLGTKVVRVLFSKGAGQLCAQGVIAVESASGRESIYTANKVVLAAGVFGTFSLLVESGIGPADALKARDVPRVLVNESIGEGIGDEVYVGVVFIAAKPQGPPPPEGPVQPLAGAKAADGLTAVGLWSFGTPTLLRLIMRMPFLLWLTQYYFIACWSTLSVSVDTPPFGKLLATKTSVEVDDSALSFTPEMQARFNTLLPSIRRFLALNRDATEGFGRHVARLFLWINSFVIRSRLATLLGTAQGVTEFNLTLRGSRRELSSYQHYYGGCGPHVVDTQYQVQGVANLHVADASVLVRLTPGAPSATVMQQGMRVADAMYGL